MLLVVFTRAGSPASLPFPFLALSFIFHSMRQNTVESIMFLSAKPNGLLLSLRSLCQPQSP